jgi:hypothetical protein
MRLEERQFYNDYKQQSPGQMPVSPQEQTARRVNLLRPPECTPRIFYLSNETVMLDGRNLYRLYANGSKELINIKEYLKHLKL